MARKILLADDSVTAQNMGRKILADAGYEVVTVNNGSAALKKIAECKPAIVVLDVYMPGYSGLEVCARIKEGRDTSGIPVLLTVGKLEPFRQEEARKVHADAFIIKPFEATELLTALSKLESRIGSQAETKPAESSRSTRLSPTVTMARYEREVADGAPRFGDQESGWKSRLTMPSPGSKHEEPAEAAEITASANKPFHESPGGTTDAPPFPVTGSALDTASSIEGLPSDVTPDELAAIAAAAAAVGSINLERDFERMPPEPETRLLEEAASKALPEKAPVETPATAASAGPAETAVTSFAVNMPPDASVVAEKPAIVVSEPAAAAVIAGSDSASLAVGGRWVAEEVPVAAAESALVLEREMQKAFAAFAAAERGASYEPGPVDKSDEPIFASIAPPPIGAPTPFAESLPATRVSERDGEASMPSAEFAVVSTSSPVPSEIAEPPAPPLTPATTEEPPHAVVAFAEPHPFERVESAQEVAPPSGELAAAPKSTSHSASPAASDAPSDEWHELRRPLAAAAASGGNGSHSAFEDFSPDKETGQGAHLEAEAQPGAMAAAAASEQSSADAALSSIVDNMLAELKPKLMAELAKKLERK